ncbi:leucyl/phenylalanyl-tRNA--protein transferase [Arachidicoccus ginsenosidimutans]|uniref:leucyl/phenylalanyl-tRNA--protein transferase n=1 Tax=Arachidicoccus sp. BS20 TaxID=1850526 RepID=UPI0007F121B0|nr:leucyl/phenylalanyl-tRNA--protein transferase [Arachidicoccus sp. BS20]ANI90606.1 leucyl/phenylalanyl-tRNA--protein transferase [Arachidicoccus sp. BS20]
MELHILSGKLWFPPVEEALSDGLLAIGGDLSEERLLLAYRNGIFPWFEDEVPLWWSPNPRFVLLPEKLKVSKSMQSILRKNIFQFTFNKNFEEVITNCQQVKRHDQDGTWITQEVRNAYINLHKKGFAISGEAWKNNQLVGGLYGVLLGKVFFGESMFSTESNASKFAFIKLVEQLKIKDIQLIDCQVYTQHLESLGAEMIDRREFQRLLKEYI